MNLNALRWQRCVLHPRPRRPRYVTRLEALEDRTLLSVCTVDRLTDKGEGKEFVGDLRYCIEQTQDKDSIQFAVEGTINLTRALPDLTRSISIEGPGADLLTVRRTPDFFVHYRIFTVSSSATVSISALTASNGDVVPGFNDGGGIFNSGRLTISNSTISGNSAIYGGGIRNSGTLTISNSIISGNDAFIGGGGIRNSGTLAISNSTISRNVANDQDKVGDGGGIFNDGMLTISNSTISQNYAAVGGGIDNFGTLVVSNSTISGNVADTRGGGVGGGIGNTGTLTINNSTISGNSSGCGGGIYNIVGTLTVSNSTISGNRAERCVGGGVGGGGINNFRILHMRNTILAGDTVSGKGVGPDLSGSLTSSGYNLIGNSSGGSGYEKTDLLDVDPLLGPLADNGGPTLTHALLEGSPAIDSGHDDDPPEWDQRGEGFARIVNDVIDRGAFEVQLGAAPSRGREALAARAGQLRAADLVAALARRRTDFLHRFDLPAFLVS